MTIKITDKIKIGFPKGELIEGPISEKPNLGVHQEKYFLKIQDILDRRLKSFENDTYNELNRFGDLNLYRYYQFVVAYKKALVKYYKEIILN